MTPHPLSVPLGSMLIEAVAILAQRKISELPVVDAEGKPAGLLDVTDLVGLLPREGPLAETSPARPSLPASGAERAGYRVFREPEDAPPA
jgi:CBS domain-containing protein